MDYNTSREHLKLREYGRNVQKLVELVKAEQDNEKRNQYAKTLVDLMKQVAPKSKDIQEHDQKIWDDLHIVSDFNLNVEAPYSVPEKEHINKKPDRVPYNTNKITYRHYGKNIEKLVKEAMKIEDEEEQKSAIIYLGKLMKSFYGTWNKETIDDTVILENIERLSGGKLSLNIEKVKQDNLFEQLYKTKRKPKPARSKKGGSSRRRRN